MFGGLAPVIHPENPNLHRVPVRKINSDYTLFVGDNFKRELTETDLPAEVKTKMAMVLASSTVNRRDKDVRLPLTIYIPPEGGQLNDVGWQVSDTMYCLCLSADTLDGLTGKSF